MKKITGLMYLCVLLFFLPSLISCHKEGVLGPQGVPGDTGAQGPAGQPGKDGANGKDGTTILTGNNTPASTLGAAGDFFLDTSTVMLYGPKTDEGWGGGVSLKGTPGTQILHGDGTPTASVGKTGDFYLDETNIKLFGPKSDAGWGAGFSLKGEQGPQGAQGAQGAQGEPGEQGPAGADGSDGADGNVNVEAFTFSTGLEWQVFGDGKGNSSYQITKHLTALDSAILLKGAIMVYVQLSDDFWYQAPFWALGINYYFNFSKGVFTLYSPLSNTGSPETVEKIKVIIIPGTSLQAVDKGSRITFGDYLKAVRVLHQ
jgi:hypothetical protein